MLVRKIREEGDTTACWLQVNLLGDRHEHSYRGISYKRSEHLILCRLRRVVHISMDGAQAGQTRNEGNLRWERRSGRDGELSQEADGGLRIPRRRAEVRGQRPERPLLQHHAVERLGYAPAADHHVRRVRESDHRDRDRVRKTGKRVSR